MVVTWWYVLVFRSQTTKGIWMARCAGIEPCTLVMDLEGTDGRERGEVFFSFVNVKTWFTLIVTLIMFQSLFPISTYCLHFYFIFSKCIYTHVSLAPMEHMRLIMKKCRVPKFLLFKIFSYKKKYYLIRKVIFCSRFTHNIYLIFCFCFLLQSNVLLFIFK